MQAESFLKHPVLLQALILMKCMEGTDNQPLTSLSTYNSAPLLLYE